MCNFRTFAVLMSLTTSGVFSGCREKATSPQEDIIPEFRHGMITGKVVQEEYSNRSRSLVVVAEQEIVIGDYDADSIILSDITNDEGYYCTDSVPVGLRDVWLRHGYVGHGHGERIENIVIHENQICEVPDILKGQPWMVFYGNLTMPSETEYDTLIIVRIYVNERWNFSEKEEFSGQYHIDFKQDTLYQFKFGPYRQAYDTTYNVTIQGKNARGYIRRLKYYFENSARSCYNVNLDFSSVPAGSTVVITLPE